jgi:putative transposase
MAKFNNQYRAESNRMPGWEYSRNGYYFLTPVVLGFICYFGKIENGRMILSDFGKIALEEWHKSFEIRNELFLDEFILMPNHLHAILIIKNPENISPGHIGNESHGNIGNESPGNIGNVSPSHIGNESHGNIGNESHGNIGNVQTHGRASLPFPESPESPIRQNKLSRPPKSISSFMAGYKSATTSKIDDFIDRHHLAMPKFNRNNRLWQTNYHDHIIRNDIEYWRIKTYIKNNPKNWDSDKFQSHI